MAGTNVTSITTDLSVTATDTLLNSDLAVSGNTTMTGDLVVGGNTTLATTTLEGILTATSTATFEAALVDGTGNSGTNGQVLFSTGNQTQWNDITTLATAPTLTGVGQLTDGGSLELAGASSVFIQGDYAYVAARDDNGLQVIDISDPSSPTGVGQLTNGGSLELNNPRSVFVQGNYAYVAANGDDGLQVIDISNPSSPTGVGQLTGTLSTNSLALDGAHFCLCPRELCLCCMLLAMMMVCR